MPPSPTKVYVGIFKVPLTKVAEPLLPVVVKVRLPCLELNVLQSAELNKPLLVADAVGKFKVILPLLVIGLFATFASVPVEPNCMPTLVTVPASVATSTIPSTAFKTPFKSLILTSPVKKPCIAILIFFLLDN